MSRQVLGGLPRQPAGAGRLLPALRLQRQPRAGLERLVRPAHRPVLEVQARRGRQRVPDLRARLLRQRSSRNLSR